RVEQQLRSGVGTSRLEQGHGLAFRAAQAHAFPGPDVDARVGADPARRAAERDLASAREHEEHVVAIAVPPRGRGPGSDLQRRGRDGPRALLAAHVARDFSAGAPFGLAFREPEDTAAPRKLDGHRALIPPPWPARTRNARTAGTAISPASSRSGRPRSPGGRRPNRGRARSSTKASASASVTSAAFSGAMPRTGEPSRESSAKRCERSVSRF